MIQRRITPIPPHSSLTREDLSFIKTQRDDYVRLIETLNQAKIVFESDFQTALEKLEIENKYYSNLKLFG